MRKVPKRSKGKYANGGQIDPQLLNAIGTASSTFNTYSTANKETPYGSNEYFDKLNQGNDFVNAGANAIASADPTGIAKAGLGVGQLASNLIAPKDAYGVSDKKDFMTFTSGLLDPTKGAMGAINDIRTGNVGWNTALGFVPWIGGGLRALSDNDRNKRERGKLRAEYLENELKGKTEAERERQDIIKQGRIQRAVSARDAGVLNYDDGYTPDTKPKLGEAFARTWGIDKGQLKNFKDGGQIKGKGTGKSDSIEAKVEAGSFIVPTENKSLAQKIREEVLGKSANKKANLNQGGGVDVRLSNGEELFTPEEVEKITAAGIDLNSLAPNAQSELSNFLKCGGDVKKYADGGPVDGKKPTDKQARAMMDDKRAKDMQERDMLADEIAQLEFDVLDTKSPNRFYNQGLLETKQKRFNDLVQRYGPPSNTAADQGFNYLKGDKGQSSSAAKPAAKSAAKTVTKSTNTPVAGSTVLNKPSSSSLVNYGLPETLDPIQANQLPVTTTSPELRTSNPSPAEANFVNSINTGTTDQYLKPRDNPLGSIDYGRIGGSLINYGLPALQTAMGFRQLKKAGDRPVDKIDPDFLRSIEAAKLATQEARNNARFGLTGEEMTALNMENVNATNAARNAARTYSGASPSTAFNLERVASNDMFGRSLASRIQDRQLKLQKEAIANERQRYVDNLLGTKLGYNRALFGDDMNAWQQKTSNAAMLANQGLSNMLAANRYEQEQKNIADRAAMSNSWMNTI